MNYTTSKDYEALWTLVQEGKEIVCMDGDGYLGRAHITEDGETRIRERDSSRLISDTESKLEFIRRCRRNEIKFFPPNEWIKINGEGDFRGMPDQDVTFVKDGKAHSGFIFEGRLTDVCDAVIGATHWMPMPEAPKE